MARVKIHPIQQTFTLSGDNVKVKQTCDFCGAEERWTSPVQPAITGTALRRTVHLVHLVKHHRQEVQATFSAKERANEIWVDADGEVER
ncbi:hypothetical protein [Streptoalloteichus tenebrarius]|nr:hypothetical protein [Streptoalloteichus tenebrarius]BFF04511.1 hypothetical protein GCM10020241_61860 [Streptoalloteichus tenebrarius]